MMTMYHASEDQMEVKRGKEKHTCVCVIHCNQCMGSVNEKGQLLQMYLEDRKRMNKQYMKLFKRLLNTMVLNYIVIYRQNVGQNVDHLKFRIDLVEGLLMKYSTLCGVSGHRDGDNITKRLT